MHQLLVTFGSLLGVSYIGTHPMCLKYYAKAMLNKLDAKVTISNSQKYHSCKTSKKKTVVVFNHGHFLDILALLSVFGASPFVALEKHINWFPMRQIVERMGCIILPYQTERSATSDKIKKHLDTGELLFIAPDGGWSTSEEWAEWKTGAFIHSDNVLPIVITYDPEMPKWKVGTSIFEALKAISHPLHIHLDVMDPIHRLPHETPQEFSARTRVQMYEKYKATQSYSFV